MVDAPGSNPGSHKGVKVRVLRRTPNYAPVAQLAEVAALEAVQCRFESYQGYQIWQGKQIGDCTGLENRRALTGPWEFDSTLLPP